MRAGELVEKDELLREVWPNTFVEEANLTQNIFMLRKVLGHERDGLKYIETVTRRGYRFVAPVRTVVHEQNLWMRSLDVQRPDFYDQSSPFFLSVMRAGTNSWSTLRMV